jgi:hypothetical protein
MADLLFICQSFPAVLDFFWLVSPLLADDFGDLRVGKPGVVSDDLSLVVLSVEDERCCKEF